MWPFDFIKFVITLRFRSMIIVIISLFFSIIILLVEYNYPSKNWDLTNILILNASTNGSAEDLKKIIQKKYSIANVDAQETWKKKHILRRTRLIFIDKPGKDNKEKALHIGQEIFRNPMLIDYKNQETTMFIREDSESLFYSNIFQGFDEKRDIVIVIGDDLK